MHAHRHSCFKYILVTMQDLGNSKDAKRMTNLIRCKWLLKETKHPFKFSTFSIRQSHLHMKCNHQTFVHLHITVTVRWLFVFNAWCNSHRYEQNNEKFATTLEHSIGQRKRYIGLTRAQAKKDWALANTRGLRTMTPSMQRMRYIGSAQKLRWLENSKIQQKRIESHWMVAFKL